MLMLFKAEENKLHVKLLKEAILEDTDFSI